MNDENKILKLSDYADKGSELETKIKYSSDFSKIPKTNLSKRILAFGVDLSTIIVLKTILDSGYIVFLSQFISITSQELRIDLLNYSPLMQIGIFVTIYCSYFLFCTHILNGKTIGKKTMGLTVINEKFVSNFREHTHLLTFKQSLKRTFGYLLSYISFGTFFIFNFSSEDKRGLSDYLSGSRTVSDSWLNHMLEHKKFNNEELNIDVSSLDKVA